MRPRIHASVAGGQGANQKKNNGDSPTDARNRKRVGGGEHNDEPERNQPQEPAEAGGEATVVAVDLRSGEVEQEDDDCQPGNHQGESRKRTIGRAEPEERAPKAEEPDRGQREDSVMPEQAVERIDKLARLAVVHATELPRGPVTEIGRASCRESASRPAGGVRARR